MSALTDRFESAWLDARAQWQSSAVLRLGLWTCLATLVLWLLLLASDQVVALQAEMKRLRADHVRLESSRTGTNWAQRLQDAQAALAAYQGMAWAEPELSLSEAALQDHLRLLAARLGLTVREIRVVRVESLGTPAAGASAPPVLPPGYGLMRARLVVDLQRTPLLSFLAECARSERGLVLERMAWRGQSQPPQAELEFRTLAQMPASAASGQSHSDSRAVGAKGGL